MSLWDIDHPHNYVENLTVHRHNNHLSISPTQRTGIYDSGVTIMQWIFGNSMSRHGRQRQYRAIGTEPRLLPGDLGPPLSMTIIIINTPHTTALLPSKLNEYTQGVIYVKIKNKMLITSVSS